MRRLPAVRSAAVRCMGDHMPSKFLTWFRSLVAARRNGCISEAARCLDPAGFSARRDDQVVALGPI